MSATVDTVDDEVTPVVELIGKAFGGDSSHDRALGPCRSNDVKVPPLVRERPLHGSDDVPALAHRAEHRLRLRVNPSDAGGRLLGESHQPKMLQSPQLEVPVNQSVVTALALPQVDDSIDQLLLNRTIDAGPALLLDLAI